MRRLAHIASLACLALAAACTTDGLLTREKTTLTPAQIADMGLECREETPIGTTIPRSICASPEQWAAYEDRTVAGTKTYFDELRRNPNDRFNGR